MIIKAWITVIRSRLTLAETCIALPPAINAPNSMPANRTPIGWALPNKATAIASNPIPAEKPGVALPKTPAIWHAPARPAKRPAILIASTIVIAGFIPPYFDASKFLPTALNSYPIVVWKINQYTKNTATIAIKKIAIIWQK